MKKTDELRPPHTIHYDFFRLNSAPQMLVVAETGAIIQANEAACTYYGLVPWPTLPPHLYDFDTNHQMVALAELNLAARNIEHTIRSTHRTILGIRDVEIRTCTAMSGSESIILATIYDVTKQTTRERIVSADEERWRFALSGSGDGVWDWDITCNEVSCSLRWNEMLGYGRHEVGVSLREWIAFVCRDDREQVTTAYENILAGGHNRMDLEYCMQHKNGDLIWIHDHCTVLRWETDGRPARLISVHSDITIQKNNETKLRTFNETLEQVVVQRTEVLKHELARREETELRLRAFQERLAALTEELCLAEERERRRLAAWLHDDVGQNLALLKIHLDRLGKSSLDERNRFQEMSRLLAGTIGEIREQTIMISPPLLENLGLIPALSKLANDMGMAHGFSVTINEYNTLPDLSSSLRTTIYSIVKELFVNIVKHAAASHVSLTAQNNGKHIEISVRDNGRGFDMEQLEATIAANNSFGLFHVKQRLNLLGGRLHTETSPGHGCACAIQVPSPCQPDVKDFPD